MLPPEVRSSLTLVTPTTVALLSTVEAKAHLRVDGSDDDTLIDTLVATATSLLDGRDGRLGRALVSQQWELRLDGFGWPAWSPGWRPFHRDRIILPLAPLLTVDSVKYIDTDGVLQTVASSVYQVVSGGARRAELVPAYAQAWLTPRAEPDCVRVTFTAGYGAEAANVPQPIRQAALMLIGSWYEQRENSVVDFRAAVAELPDGVERLLAPYALSWF